MKKISLILNFSFLILNSTSSQQHYTPPTDPLVIKKLSEWQNWKFGLLMHWGTYCQWGVVESWSICPEDEGWTQRDPVHGKTYNEYKKNYEDLQKTFNPVNFDPDQWAAAAKDAGMKYVVFTTKHHDGFSMFDSKQTDYKVTSAKTPFSSNPKKNIANEVFNAFRKQGLATGAYFSKPDWHNENYWWPYFPPKDRNVNYDPKKYPARWQAFKDFTYNQIKELMSEYGKMDILWLDGGWVRPKNTIDTTVEWQRTIKDEQDIDMPKIASMARGYQPGLLIVDRSVGYEYENYITPEQHIPPVILPTPWESCITMASSWSHVPGDKYKSTNELIHLLIKIVTGGGNLLLNIGPDAKGEWDKDAYIRLKEIGEWMKINGEAIYKTKPFGKAFKQNEFYTQNDSAVYMFKMMDEQGYPVSSYRSFTTDAVELAGFTKYQILGIDKIYPITKNEKGITILYPEETRDGILKHAVVFKLMK